MSAIQYIHAHTCTYRCKNTFCFTSSGMKWRANTETKVTHLFRLTQIWTRSKYAVLTCRPFPLPRRQISYLCYALRCLILTPKAPNRRQRHPLVTEWDAGGWWYSKKVDSYFQRELCEWLRLLSFHFISLTLTTWFCCLNITTWVTGDKNETAWCVSSHQRHPLASASNVKGLWLSCGIWQPGKKNVLQSGMRIKFETGKMLIHFFLKIELNCGLWTVDSAWVYQGGNSRSQNLNWGRIEFPIQINIGWLAVFICIIAIAKAVAVVPS